MIAIPACANFYCNPDIPLAVRMRAAMAAIPYEMPRLAVTGQVSENDFAEILDRRLKHMEAIAANEPKMIEAKRIDPVEVKPRKASNTFAQLSCDQLAQENIADA